MFLDLFPALMPQWIYVAIDLAYPSFRLILFLLKLMKLLILRRLHLPWLLSNFRLLKLFSMLILLLALVVLWLQIVPSDAAADEASPKDAFVVGSRIELLMPLQLSVCRSECC